MKKLYGYKTKNNKTQLKLWLIVISLLWVNMSNAYSQKVEYGSFDELLNDIKSRRLEKPISFMSQELYAIEKGEKTFIDDEYIGYTTLLSTCFIQNNQPYRSDSLLSHVIDYMQCTGRTSPYSYALHSAYGSLLMSLENYALAEKQLEASIREMRLQNVMGENFAVIESMLAVCHINMGNTTLAKKEIEEAIAIIEMPAGELQYATNKMGIYQKAGFIYHELKDFKRAIEYTENAYNLARDNDSYISEYLNAARNLATLKLNNGDYDGALGVLHEIEGKPMFESERASVYSRIYQAYYFLNNENECVKYAQLCSNTIMCNTSSYYTSFPGTTIEDMWDTSAVQLKLNIGILAKFPNNAQAAMMSYDNTLFVKRLLYDRMASLHNISKKYPEVYSTITDIKRIRTNLFVGDTSQYTQLYLKETELIRLLKSIGDTTPISAYHWQDVCKSLGRNDVAIEVITYVGFPKDEFEKKELRLGALILKHGISAPIFVDICTHDSLLQHFKKTVDQREIGLNTLYANTDTTELYNLVWKPLSPYVQAAKRIFISPTLTLQNFNIGFMPCPDGKYLNNHYDIHIVTSTSIVCKKNGLTALQTATLYGGIDYSRELANTATTSIRGLIETESINRGLYGHLVASSREVDRIGTCLNEHKISTCVRKGFDASESSFRQLDGASPTILHLSTHGFFVAGTEKFNNYFGRLIPYFSRDSLMTRTGLLLADANNSLSCMDSPAFSDGVLTAEEISWMNMSETQLVVLSACETALGISANEGFGGLVRAFKMAGARHVVASLWPVPDKATADLMISFYKHLMKSKRPHEALIKAQRETAAIYSDPYYWAAFIIID